MDQRTIQNIVDAVITSIRSDPLMLKRDNKTHATVQSGGGLLDTEGNSVGEFIQFAHVGQLLEGDVVEVDHHRDNKMPTVVGIIDPRATDPVGTTYLRRKTGDESVTSSIAYQDDDIISFAVEANFTYEINVNLIYVGISSTVAGGLRWNFTMPSSSQFYGGQTNGLYQGAIGGSASSVNAYALNVAGTSNLNDGFTNVGTWAGGATSGVILVIKGLIIPGADGTVTLQWAQAVSSGTATTVRAGSWATLTRVA